MGRARWGGVLLGLGLVAVRELVAIVRMTRAADPGGRHDHAALVGAGTGPPLRLLLLGDSAVDGHGLGVEESLPRRVAERLAERTGRRVEVRSVAVSGATSADVAALQLPLLEQVRAVGEVDAVVVGVGVNDALQRVRPTAVTEATRSIVRGVRSIAPSAAFAYVPCHDLGGAPGPGPVLRAVLGARCRAVARWQHAVLTACEVPVAVGDGRGTPEQFGSDGLHPGPAGVEVIATHVARALGTRATR